MTFRISPRSLRPAPRRLAWCEDRTGHRFGVGIVSLRLAEGPRIAVIEALPYAELMAATIAVRDSSLIAGLAAAFCAFLLAILVARSLTRPLVQMTKVVEGFSRGETVALPAGGGHEIGVLATAFADMAAEFARQDGSSARKRADGAGRRRQCARRLYPDRRGR